MGSNKFMYVRLTYLDCKKEFLIFDHHNKMQYLFLFHEVEKNHSYNRHSLLRYRFCNYDTMNGR